MFVSESELVARSLGRAAEQMDGGVMLLLVTRSCPGLCDPVDSSLAGFSVGGLSQARIPQ